MFLSRRLAAALFASALGFAACTLKASHPRPDQTAAPEEKPPEVDYASAEPPPPEALQPQAEARNALAAPRKKSAGLRDEAEPYVASAPAAPAAVGAGGLAKNAPAPKGMCAGCRRDLQRPEPEDAYVAPPPAFNTEEYARIYENPFLAARKNPLSTFSIDVDAASYANVRRFIQGNQLPPPDAVRIEEFINYFKYDYPQPDGDAPFSINTEVAACPWNAAHKLVHIGLQGLKIDPSRLPPANLVFLIDVSGSMDEPQKLPLLKRAFHLLIEQLRPQDRVSICVYAGNAGLVLPPTSGADKAAIGAALNRLEAGGSTAGGAGLMLAYRIAQQSFLPDGNNRIILATDGDFNVGVSSDGDLIRLIERKRKSGVFLSVLGFGMGNYKDAKMEQLADKGNGNYAYIDNIMEARKVFVEELGGTLFTIAKDVKLQIEFNPAKVGAYRLIGYENRLLRAEDFNDDSKDAGELGAGHAVTALYEIAPAGAGSALPKVDPLKYQPNPEPGKPSSREAGAREPRSRAGSWRETWPCDRCDDNQEILTVKFRYKDPDGNRSKLLTRVLRDGDASWENASENFRFSAAAAGLGLLLRGSRYKGDLDYDKVLALAQGARGKDAEGHRAEFIRLAEAAKLLAEGTRLGRNQVPADPEEE